MTPDSTERNVAASELFSAATETYNQIRAAVERRLTVVALYDGYRRELCPHEIGWKKGVPHALFYQRAGDSSKGVVVPGSASNWRCLDLSKLQILEVKASGWEAIPRRIRRSSCLDEIDLEVPL